MNSIWSSKFSIHKQNFAGHSHTQRWEAVKSNCVVYKADHIYYLLFTEKASLPLQATGSMQLSRTKAFGF